MPQQSTILLVNTRTKEKKRTHITTADVNTNKSDSDECKAEDISLGRGQRKALSANTEDEGKSQESTDDREEVRQVEFDHGLR